jgi:hypothetical protein
VKFESHHDVLLRRVEDAHEHSTVRVLDLARANAHKVSGEHGASLRATAPSSDVGRLTSRIGSPLPQAGAVERGANVGPRRGPHMKGAHAIERAGEQYPTFMTDELRRAG